MKHFTLKKLNAIGVAHMVALMLVVVGAGVIGTYLLIESHADSIRVNCYDSKTRYNNKFEKYNCEFYTTAYVKNSDNHIVGTLHSGFNWILCQEQGPLVERVGSNYDNWWGYTLADNGHWGWVSGVYGKGGANNGTYLAPHQPHFGYGAFGYGIASCEALGVPVATQMPGTSIGGK